MLHVITFAMMLATLIITFIKTFRVLPSIADKQKTKLFIFSAIVLLVYSLVLDETFYSRDDFILLNIIKEVFLGYRFVTPQFYYGLGILGNSIPYMVSLAIVTLVLFILSISMKRWLKLDNKF